MNSPNKIYIALIVTIFCALIMVNYLAIGYNATQETLEFEAADKPLAENKGNPIRVVGSQLANALKEITSNTTAKQANNQETSNSNKAAKSTNNGQTSNNRTDKAFEGEQQSDVTVIPTINDEDIHTVDFKMLTQSGKVDIVDIEGITYLDVTSLASWYNRRLGWNYEEEQFILILFGVDFRGKSLSEEIYINGKATSLNEPIYIIDYRPYIPAEAFAQSVGAEIKHEDELLEIRIRNFARVAMTLLRS
ncbi:stalk domain-containing protein [Desulfuribacillus alkaliarsenatis]|uniref:Copper amine oxidase-like N-terminal domain-containing protein n=1 Tax=Desulfuribacillus alkaliarsenatis TaxID=766136 RepID=A0A1E5G1E2_9FIRM|nr:stalk domain-containing protein [Desulfuribacillus alkaliarsenatis]OEF96683.1 hypothetical protein BHF68_06295 [Desulfuribacillus alkaliarsenatis]